MRIFKRLFPIFLVPVLLAGVALAQPAVQTRVIHGSGLNISKSQFIQSYSYAPSPPRFYFGTVVRDTADDQNVTPGQRQAPQKTSLCGLSFIWNWFSLLIPR